MTPAKALSDIRHTAKFLPQSVGSHHRTTLYEAAAALEDTTKELLEALYSSLNVEGIGPEQAEKIGLDYAWHFAKVRAAIAKAEGRQ